MHVKRRHFWTSIEEVAGYCKKGIWQDPILHWKVYQCKCFPWRHRNLKGKDIEKLPFLTKDDLRACYPFGMFAVDKKEIIEVHSSSGTTGKPVVSGYTQSDIDNWGEIVARGLTMMGLDEDDIIQNTHGYGLFTGSLHPMVST